MSCVMPSLTLERFAAHVQAINSLSHKDDNPSSIPRRELAKVLYGKGSVFARNPTEAQVSSQCYPIPTTALLLQWGASRLSFPYDYCTA